jgi:hypothetical protein
MKFAYADPPYPGQAKKHYKDHKDYGGEVDHKELIEQLCRDYPDGWALSTNSVSLKMLLPLCPDDIRVMAWVKPFCSFKPNVNPAYAWEPVIVRGGRKRGREKPTVRDFVSVNITLKKGLSGAKPKDFCFWLFEVLGAKEGDEIDDLFPGTGIVSECWEEFQSEKQQNLQDLDKK